MPQRETYVPKHRAVPTRPAVEAATTAPQKALRAGVLMAGIAVAATGVTVAGGVAVEPDTTSGDATSMALTGAATALDAEAGTATDELAEREPVVSRSDSRDQADPDKLAALDTDEGPAVTRSAEVTPSDPRDIARALLPEYGFSADQFGCLDSLYVSESDWDMTADNPTSSAYGIPQALTETHDMPPGYFTSAEVQIRWGLNYIRDSYGTPCNAWSFKQGNNWY